MQDLSFAQTNGWAACLAAAIGLQFWWFAGNGPDWLPVVTGPTLVGATMVLQRATRRRSVPEIAARVALRADHAARGPAPGSGGLFGARQG